MLPLKAWFVGRFGLEKGTVFTTNLWTIKLFFLFCFEISFLSKIVNVVKNWPCVVVVTGSDSKFRCTNWDLKVNATCCLRVTHVTITHSHLAMLECLVSCLELFTSHTHGCIVLVLCASHVRLWSTFTHGRKNNCTITQLTERFLSILFAT